MFKVPRYIIFISKILFVILLPFLYAYTLVKEKFSQRDS